MLSVSLHCTYIAVHISTIGMHMCRIFSYYLMLWMLANDYGYIDSTLQAKDTDNITNPYNNKET